jgi:hypothetical protein
MKLFFAAPFKGLPSDPSALGVQVSLLHFVTKLVFAAPASGLPSFPIALLSHVPGACAAAEPIANAVSKTASINRVIFPLLFMTNMRALRCAWERPHIWRPYSG